MRILTILGRRHAADRFCQSLWFGRFQPDFSLSRTGDQEKARHCAAFCIWTGAAVALLYGVAAVLLEPVLFPVLGAGADTWAYCRQYAFWTIGVGAVPTVMNAELAHPIRAEGYSGPAGFGVAFGDHKRMKAAIKTAFACSFLAACVGAVLLWMLAAPICRWFIADAETVRYGPRALLALISYRQMARRILTRFPSVQIKGVYSLTFPSAQDIISFELYETAAYLTGTSYGKKWRA